MMTIRRLCLVCLTAALTLLALSGGWVVLSENAARAAPGVLYVAPGGNCGGASPCYSTVQAAVDAALEGDEIRVAAGIYPLQGGASQIVLVQKSLSIRGGYTTGDWNTPDADANLTILNALSQGRVMVISGTVEVTLEGLRLIYGNAAGLGGHDCFIEWDAGGALYIDQATVALRHTWVLTNSTSTEGFGGGLYANESILVMSDGTIIRSNYAGTGGGIFLTHTRADLSNVTVQDNNAGYRGSCQHGGGGLNIINDSQVTISDSAINGNTSLITEPNGGILIQDGSLVITGSSIEDNAGNGLGLGGSYIGSDKATAVLADNIIQNNAGNGVAAGSLGVSTAITMTHNLVQGNVTNGWGAGLAISSRAVLIGNIIQDNQTAGSRSMRGGGVYLSGDSEPILFQGNIVRGNTTWHGVGGVGGGIYVTGQYVTLEGNLIQGNSAESGISDSPGSGGGIYIAGNATLINNIISDNSVGGGSGMGAGITVAGAQPTLYHNTIARNLGGHGSGVYVTEAAQPGLPLFYNTLIAEQTIGVQVDGDPPQNLATLYGVLWWNNTTNIAGSAFAFDQVSGDPLFVDPEGGDYHIAPGSAAIDAGIEVETASDFDGQTRPHYAGYDLGADEWWPLVAIKSVTPGSAEPGEVVTYTLALTNATAAPMMVMLTDTLPAEVGFVGPLLYNNGNGSYASGVITWAGEVLTSSSTLITWAVEIAPGVAGGTTIANTAVVSDVYGIFQTDPALVEVPRTTFTVQLPLAARNFP